MTDVQLLPDDVVFADVTVIDGSGTVARFRASVVVRGDMIVGVHRDGSLLDAAQRAGVRRIINGEQGRWALCPGFIDMHAHSDLALLHTPAHTAKISQGCTLEVVGQDGVGYAPVDDATMARVRVQIAGWNGNPREPHDFFDRWRSVRQYLDLLDAERVATNVAYLVPQGNLRMLAVGWQDVRATGEQLSRMQSILAEALDEGGAVGLSSGLTYVPGMFADEAELEALLRVVQQRGAYYCPHTRSYGKGCLKAYEDMIGLAQRTGCRLHLTHAVLNFGENADRAEEFIKLVDDAIKDGIKVSLDTYPYLPGSTTLSALLPSWAAAAGDVHALLNDEASLNRIRQQALVTGTDGCHGCVLEWETIEIAGVQDPSLAPLYVGKTLAQIALDERRPPFDVFIDILKRDNLGTLILQHVGHEANVRRIMRHERHCAGSDGILSATKPHPRGWGTFARYLGHYGRDLTEGKQRRITDAQATDADTYEACDPCTVFAGGLEETVAHLTSRPAAVIGVQKTRGMLRVGMRADLCLFDPTTVSDMATFAKPERPAKGIRAVLVNGRFALDEGRPTGERAGRTIRRRKAADGSFHVE